MNGWRGAVAQMGERCNRTAEVRGSIPLSSTSPPNLLISIAEDSMASKEDLETTSVLNDLSTAARLFAEGGEARLAGMFHAIRILMEHLSRVGADDEQLVPLRALLHALDHLNHGQKAPVLAPRRGFSAIDPDREPGAFVAKQAAALVVEEVLFRGFGGKRGCRRLAQKAAASMLARHGFKSRSGRPITENILRQWRTDLATAGDEFAQLRNCVEPLLASMPEQIDQLDAARFAQDLAKGAANDPSI
jgi:hypothetical protein